MFFEQFGLIKIGGVYIPQLKQGGLDTEDFDKAPNDSVLLSVNL